MKLAIVGFGDLGRYMKDVMLEFCPLREEDILYFDDIMATAGEPNSYAFKLYADPKFAAYDFWVCLGYKHLQVKRRIIEELVGLGRSVPHFVHPSSYAHPSVKIGHGSYIYPGCSIDRNTTIGNGTFISNGDVIAHDCNIGHGCWFGASVTLSGKVEVGNHSFIGSGATVSNDLHIGSNVIIGLSTAVTKSVKDGLSVIGNPMRILEKPIQLS